MLFLPVKVEMTHAGPFLALAYLHVTERVSDVSNPWLRITIRHNAEQDIPVGSIPCVELLHI